LTGLPNCGFFLPLSLRKGLRKPITVFLNLEQSVSRILNGGKNIVCLCYIYFCAAIGTMLKELWSHDGPQISCFFVQFILLETITLISVDCKQVSFRDYYTSVVGLQYLSKAEENINSALLEYSKTLKERLFLIEQLSQLFSFTQSTSLKYRM